MDKFIYAAMVVLCLGLSSCKEQEDSLKKTVRKLNQEREDKNKQTVEEWGYICQSSACVSCGRFFWEDGLIKYEPTSCEEDFKKEADNVEIRKKYIKH